MKTVYKYLSPDVLALVFSKPGFVRLRCSYPNDFNDPFELFLTIDTRKLSRKLVAFYNEILGQIPLLPTTCFSNRPDIIPMWAHYANNSTGFVIEMDEERLLQSFSEGTTANDVEYDTTPLIIDQDDLAYAYETAKPRHTYLLKQYAFTNAYFKKNACWKYEDERRLVVRDSDVMKENGLVILEVPASCVRSIISGPLSIDTVIDHCVGLCKTFGCQYYQMKLGRSSLTPFFIARMPKSRQSDAAQKHSTKSFSQSTYSLTFDQGALTRVKHRCTLCGEPMTPRRTTKCDWCSLTMKQKQEAAARNPFRILEHAGLLEAYLEDCNRIWKKE